jgi:hypothetical protein
VVHVGGANTFGAPNPSHAPRACTTIALEDSLIVGVEVALLTPAAHNKPASACTFRQHTAARFVYVHSGAHFRGHAR